MMEVSATTLQLMKYERKGAHVENSGLLCVLRRRYSASPERAKDTYYGIDNSGMPAELSDDLARGVHVDV